jgi:hypothetical protein
MRRRDDRRCPRLDLGDRSKAQWATARSAFGPCGASVLVEARGRPNGNDDQHLKSVIRPQRTCPLFRELGSHSRRMGSLDPPNSAFF